MDFLKQRPEIHQGAWRDESSGRLLLTLRPIAASMLVPVLTTWVHLVGHLTWPVVRFILWQMPARRGDNGVFFAQRQVLLRDSTSGISALVSLVKLVFSWRSQRRPHATSLVQILTTAAVVSAWLVAGLLVSRIHKLHSDHVLLARSPHCGIVVQNDTSKKGDALGFSTRFKEVQKAQSYLDECYDAKAPLRVCPFPTLGFSSRSGVFETTNSDWKPDAALFNASDADISILAVEANAVRYAQANFDPVFGASVPYPEPEINMTLYGADVPVAMLACTEQQQICLPSLGNRCTPLAAQNSLMDAYYALQDPHVNLTTLIQTDVVRRITQALETATLFSPLFWGGGDLLLASSSFSILQTATLNNEHWQDEVKNLFYVALIQIQQSILSK